MSQWPVLAVGLRLQGQPVLLVGAGAVAAEKLEKLLRCGAVIDVVAPQACQQVRQWAQDGLLRWIPRPFAAEDVAGRLMVLSATGREGVDLEVFAQCEKRHILCNSADVPEACTAWLMAQAQHGPLTVAVGTSGTAPGLSRRLLQEALSGLPADIADLVDRYGRLRRWVIDDLAPGPSQLAGRMELLRRLAKQPWSWLRGGTADQRAELLKSWVAPATPPAQASAPPQPTELADKNQAADQPR